MGLSFVAVFLYAGSMSTSDIVAAQDQFWFAIILLPSFLIYLVSMVGETNRAPFDLPEAEGELVGGFHTEYSSLKFALFFLAEYINMFTVAALATTLFLGGWQAPWPLGGPDLGGRQRRLVAGAVVRREALGLHVRLHLAARDAAEAALRPVHEAGLEGADPDLAGLDRGRRHGAGAGQRGESFDRPRRSLWGAGIVAVLLVLSVLWDVVAGRGDRSGRGGRAGPVRPVRRRPPCPAAARDRAPPTQDAVGGRTCRRRDADDGEEEARCLASSTPSRGSG